MTQKLFFGLIVFSLLFFGGCAGTQNALMTSSTGLGIDMDSKPPHMDIAFSRREIAIEPAFEGGATLPSSMTFKASTTTNPLKWLGFGIGSTFSTGKAAAILTGNTTTSSSKVDDDGTVEVSEVPVSWSLKEQWQHRHELPGPGIMRPLVFGTKTVLGVHASWDGSAAYVPSELKVGFHRKEIAYAPVSYKGVKPHLKVGLPSTFAAINTGSDTKTQEGNFSLLQYFATGTAADNLASNPKLKEVMQNQAVTAAKTTDALETASQETPEASQGANAKPSPSPEER